MKVLTSEGLLRYVDSRCIQRELSEVAGISEEQMDEAAHELLYMRQEDAPVAATPSQTIHDAAVPGSARPPFYEHLGGYGMHELHDFNQYSNRPTPTASSSGSGVWWWWHRRRRRRQRQKAASRSKSPVRPQTVQITDETTMMYITSV